MTQQQSVLDWLKDAHAMEEGGAITLANHAATAHDYPEMQRKLKQHAETTRRHAELLKGCIERLGGHPSALKEAIGTVMGKVQGVANLPAKDTVVKNALGDFAAENFEIACYRSLIAAAEKVGDRRTADVCGQILRDEEEMAGWLAGQIPAITRTFLDGQAGEGAHDGQGSTLGAVKQTVTQTVKNLGEQGKGVASSVAQRGKRVAEKGKNDALIVSGALIAGAGAAILIAQALRGSGERRESGYERFRPPPGDVYSAPPAGATTGSAFEGSFVNERPAADVQTGVQSESLLEPDPLDLDADTLFIAEVQVETQDLLDTSDLSGEDQAVEDQILIDTLSEDARALAMSDAQSQEQGVGGGVDPIVEATTTPPAPESDAQGADEPSAVTEIWLMPGPYSGLGPIGYDSAGDPIGQEVYSRLTQHGHVDATEIEIVIDNGEVLLEGTVDSEATKRLAEEAVASIGTVRSVQNLLRVRTDESN